MDIDEGATSPVYRRRESSFNANEFIWTVDRANELLSEYTSAQASKKPLYVDSKFFKQAKEKVQTI